MCDLGGATSQPRPWDIDGIDGSQLPVVISSTFGSHLVLRWSWGQGQPLALSVQEAGGAFFQDFLAKQLVQVHSQLDPTQHRTLRTRHLGFTLAHFLSCSCLTPDQQFSGHLKSIGDSALLLHGFVQG